MIKVSVFYVKIFLLSRVRDRIWLITEQGSPSTAINSPYGQHVSAFVARGARDGSGR